MRCPGSVALATKVERTESTFANEGTAAHMLAERCLRQDLDAEKFRGCVIDIRGSEFIAGKVPDGVHTFLVDAEMIEAVQLYLDVVREIKASADEFEIEHKVDVGPFLPGVFGTGDVIAYHQTATGGRVSLVDLKYGKGVAVEVDDNEQLLTYAAGVANRYHNRGVDEIELVIVQPRSPHRLGPVRRWQTDMLGLMEHVHAIQAAAEKIKGKNAPLVAGSHCKFCDAAPICPAIRDKVFTAIGAKLENGRIIAVSDPTKFTPEQLAEAMANSAIVLTWLRGVEQYAHAEAMRGRVPPGYKLVGKRALRRWADETTAVDTLRLLGLDDDEIYETKLASPAVVEKLLPKKERATLSGLVVKASSGSVLAPLDDPRPAIDPNDASGFEPMAEAD